MILRVLAGLVAVEFAVAVFAAAVTGGDKTDWTYFMIGIHAIAAFLASIYLAACLFYFAFNGDWSWALA